jgi:hypothetical protein
MWIERHYRGSSEVSWRIGVSSREVRSEHSRGRDNTTFTSNIAKAISNAKKFLVRPKLGELMYEKGTTIAEQYDRALFALEADIGRGRLMGDQSQMQLLLNSYLRGQEPDEKLAAVYRATVTTPQYEKALSEFMLAQYMRFHPDGSLPICLMPEGLYAFFTGGELLGSRADATAANVQLVPFEALPDPWQDRVAVLQLVSDRELVKDVGFRLDESNFLIIK